MLPGHQPDWPLVLSRLKPAAIHKSTKWTPNDANPPVASKLDVLSGEKRDATIHQTDRTVRSTEVHGEDRSQSASALTILNQTASCPQRCSPMLWGLLDTHYNMTSKGPRLGQQYPMQRQTCRTERILGPKRCRHMLYIRSRLCECIKGIPTGHRGHGVKTPWPPLL